MRKVVNTRNQGLLATLGTELIAPLLRVLTHAKSLKCRVQETAALAVVTQSQQKILAAVFAISLGKAKGKTFGARCNAAIKFADATLLAGLPNEYAAQVADLHAGKNPVQAVVIPKTMTLLFKDTLYGKLFGHEDVWKALGLAQLTRDAFHKNFKADNTYPGTCPYCDLDTINSPGAGVVEHLFPKSKFPLLALDGHNLFTSCWACNGPAGKLSGTVAQLASPYDHEVGTLVDFKHDPASMVLEISAKPGRADVAGYLALLKLPVRYADPATWYQFDARREALVDAMRGKRVADLPAFEAYVAKQQKGAVLTYAVSDWARTVLGPAKIRRAKKTRP